MEVSGMTDREKLVDLIYHVAEGHVVNLMQPGGAEALADHLIANGVTVQRMTPITEEIPPGECLAVNTCGAYMVGKIVKDPYCTITGYACMSDIVGTEFGIGDVTHWQPLPEPLKAREGQNNG